MRLRDIDPLFQFLGIGALLFALSALVRPFGGDDTAIVVDRPALENYLAAGGGETLSAAARRQGGAPTLDALSDDERRALVDHYVEEQALYREARGWGLDDGDLVIRRRLGQSLKFALRPVAAPDPGDAVLRAFYARNMDKYRAETATSFDHVFFATDLRGADGARRAAMAAATGSMPDWRAAGDRFPYQRSYVDAGPGLIASELGRDFLAGLDALPPAPDRWQGPIASDLGYHLVRLNRRADAHTDAFADIRPAVLDDWRRARQQDELGAAVDRIVVGYRAQVDPGVFAD